MSDRSRRDRGRETELVVAADLAATIFPSAEANGRSLSGRDVKNTPGVAVEVKARRSFQPLQAMRQATRNAQGDLPVVVMRPDGMGPATLDQWPVFMPYWAWKELLRRAGMGQ